MRYSPQVKSISHLEANAAELLDQIAQQETLALLEILALGQREIELGQTKPISEVMQRLGAKRKRLA